MTNFADMLSKAKAMQDKMKEAQEKIKNIKLGLVVTCVGDSGCMTYKRTRQNNSEIDRTVIDVLKNGKFTYELDQGHKIKVSITINKNDRGGL